MLLYHESLPVENASVDIYELTVCALKVCELKHCFIVSLIRCFVALLGTNGEWSM